MATTGVGYAGSVVLDASVSAALAYAIGESSKSYFKGTRDKKELGKILKNKFTSAKQEYDQRRNMSSK